MASPEEQPAHVEFLLLKEDGQVLVLVLKLELGPCF